MACAHDQRQAARQRVRQRQRVQRVAVTALLATFLTVAPSARSPSTVDDLLSEPPSPAADALLTEHVADPRVGVRWVAGLASVDPLMRATAARLLGMQGTPASAGAVRRALATETDPHARGELARALIVLGDAADDGDVLDAVRRVDPIARRRALTTLAVLRPASLAADIRRASTRSVVVGEVGTVLDVLFESSTADADRVMSLIALRPDTTGLAQMLNAAARWRRPVPDAALETALDDAGLVPPALGYLAAMRDDDTARHRVGSVARVAVHRTAVPAAPMRSRSPEDTVLFALRDRWVGLDTPDLRGAIAALRDGSAVYTLPDDVLVVLSRDERRALAQRFDLSNPVRALLARVAFQRLPRGAAAARRQPVRLLSDLPPGLAAGLRLATGCASSESIGGTAVVRYRPDGRPVDIAIDTRDLSTACARYAHTLVRLAWGPPGLAPTQPVHLVVPVDNARAECDGRVRPPVLIAASARELAADLARPVRVAHREPSYPQALRSRGVWGTVTVDTRIDDAGCVASAQVIGSVDPILDVEAVRAVSAWRYRPATLDGTPVPVQMDVAVQFVLKR
jgi:TonB family protein